MAIASLTAGAQATQTLRRAVADAKVANMGGGSWDDSNGLGTTVRQFFRPFAAELCSTMVPKTLLGRKLHRARTEHEVAAAAKFYGLTCGGCRKVTYSMPAAERGGVVEAPRSRKIGDEPKESQHRGADLGSHAPLRRFGSPRWLGC